MGSAGKTSVIRKEENYKDGVLTYLWRQREKDQDFDKKCDFFLRK